MNNFKAISPLVFIFASITFFLCYILLSKQILLESSVLIFVFFRFIFASIIEAIFIRKTLTFSFKISKPGIHLLMSFANLGFYYCFFGSLTHLPLMLAVAIYLAYPLFVPFILRIWMGRRFKALFAFGTYLAWIGILFSFDPKFRLNNILVVVAMISSLLKAISWTGYHRLQISESTMITWLIKYLVAIFSATLLLVGSWKMPSFSILTLILIVSLFERVSLWSFQKSLRENNQLKMICLFNTSLFFCAVFDPLFFHLYIPFKPFLCATLIYFGIFFTFLQKNILPNSIYDL